MFQEGEQEKYSRMLRYFFLIQIELYLPHKFNFNIISYYQNDQMLLLQNVTNRRSKNITCNVCYKKILNSIN